MVQWLGLGVSTVRETGLIPGQGTRIPHAAKGKKKKKSQSIKKKTRSPSSRIELGERTQMYI